MNIVSIHIDETLAARDIEQLKASLSTVPHVVHVQLNSMVPHDLMVEYEAHHNIPMTLLERLSKQGLHSDIQYC